MEVKDIEIDWLREKSYKYRKNQRGNGSERYRDRLVERKKLEI